MSAKFVVDATGRSANVASKLGAKKQRIDKLVGIYQYYHASAHACHSIDSTTVIEAMDHGWWYSAALPSGKRVVTLMTDSDFARQNQYRRGQNFRQALSHTQHLRQRLNGHVIASQPKVIAANTQRLDKLAGIGWLATGDAAFTFDPLSSLGMFKALRMAVIASYAATDYFSGKDSKLAKFQWFANAEFASYLDKKREYYLQEGRFKQQPFWQRRRAA
jgi:flavin-dependent dehydrogenase